MDDLVLSFCLVDFVLNTLRPNDITPLCDSSCHCVLGTTYDASTHVYSSVRLSSTITCSSLIVVCRKCRSRRSLVQSCSMPFEILVHKNAVVNSVSGRPHFATHSSFIKMLTKHSFSPPRAAWTCPQHPIIPSWLVLLRFLLGVGRKP